MGSPSPFDAGSWNGVEGAYYMGMGSSWELIWLIVSIVLCIMALWVGGRHESAAYDRQQSK